MAIILEGPNGVGKTTLANELHGLTGYPSITYKKNTLANKRSSIADGIRDAIVKNLIIDRFPALSETIYAEIVDKREAIITPKTVIKLIKNFTIKRKKVLFLVLFPINEREVYERQHNIHFGFDTYTAICDQYNNFVRNFEDCPNVLPIYGDAINPHDIFCCYKAL